MFCFYRRGDFKHHYCSSAKIKGNPCGTKKAVIQYDSEHEQLFNIAKESDCMRMRTIEQAADYVREHDPGTALTKTAIRRKVLSGEIPSTRAGKKYLLDLDRLEEFLFITPPTNNGEIRPVRG